MSPPAFTAVRSTGGLLPADLLSRLVGGTGLAGLTPGDYHLAAGETVRAAANRAWAYLTGAWASFRRALEALPAADRATTLTREKWLLLLFRELGFGRLPTTGAGGITVDDRSFPISHRWEQVPVHLLGWRVDLDRRTPGLAGAAEVSPQSLVQECLNRCAGHRWGMLSNGRLLRLLRDSASLVGSAYVEFDLEAIFDGELFSDFVLLFLLCHQSRVETLTVDGTPGDCWLERWRTEAIETGTRALTQLRDGVATAIEHLGSGFLAHPANSTLRHRLAVGALRLEDYQRALLRCVYRLLFLFVAEDRDALLDPAAPPQAHRRYTEFFSTRRLRQVAQRRRGGRHGDLWRALVLVIDGLGAEAGRPELALPGLGGLFEPGELDLLQHLELPNQALLAAVRALSTITDRAGGPRRTVDYRHLGAEELGSVYESLLELMPGHDPATATFRLTLLAGNERKTTGAYYTPTSLVEGLLDSALDPLLDEATNAADPARALLEITVCDPACGSGHFLVAAARRIAKRLAPLTTGDPEPPPESVRAAVRTVIARCIYGVDVNPLAAELAKVSLWLEALDPGQPLSFLDAHIKVGNSLLGVTPALLADGLPDTAFKPIEGDDRTHTAALAKRNRAERDQADQLTLAEVGLHIANTGLANATRSIDEQAGPSLTDVHVQARRHRQLEAAPELARAREVADAWCAAFVQPKTPSTPAVTHRTLLDLDHDPDSVPPPVRNTARGLASQYRFFHWHLEFPHIFTVPATPTPNVDPVTGWTGGFTCILGNPPWEHTELKEQEFFAARAPEIADAAGAARKRLIAALERNDPALWNAYQDAKRQADGVSHFGRASGRYPLCGRGRINTYALFAENDRTILGPHGRLGVILPTGIATDATTQHFFRDVVENSSLVSLYDFENARPIFEGVHRSFKFCLLTLTGRVVRQAAADFAFFLHDAADLARPGARFALKPDEITLLNPNTGTCPIFRSRRDAEITLAIYRRIPILLREGDPDGNPWHVSFMQGLFNMTSDSHLFHTRQELEAQGWHLDGNIFIRGTARMLPLYEGRMGHQYNHRFADSARDSEAMQQELEDADFVVLPQYWIEIGRTEERLARRRFGCRSALLGHRRVARSTDERTCIASLIPWGAASYGWILSTGPDALNLTVLLSCYDSFVYDYILRNCLSQASIPQSTSEQTPVPPPSSYQTASPWNAAVELRDWITDRVLELSYTAWDMEPAAQDLYDDGPPFVWDDERRTLIRAELDAAYFHLYGLDRDDVGYILDTFPIVRRKDEQRFGEYRTKRLILEIYEAMTKAIQSGEPYQTILDPPPGQGPRHEDR